jgi:type VI secretion system protein ImpA
MEVRKRLRALLLNGEWLALLNAAEDVMAEPWGRGWLDLQRYILTALAGLGGPYGGVADAIRDELTLLLREVPDLVSKTLMDDTPVANAETVEWLRLNRLIPGPDGEAGAEPQSAPDYDQERLLSEATHEKALEWAASGNPGRGVELLKRRAEGEKSQRGRFITESLTASILVDSGLESIARPMLEDLVDRITKRNLGEWEPADVVARPLGLLYRCLPANDRRRSQLYDQICRLDPVLAMSLEKGANGLSAKAPPPNARSQDEPTPSPSDGAPVDPGSPDS